MGAKLRFAGGCVCMRDRAPARRRPLHEQCNCSHKHSQAQLGNERMSGANLTGAVRLHLIVVNASAGTVQLQASNSSGGGTVTLKANSDLVARRTI